jgi:hypothetical protein
MHERQVVVLGDISNAEEGHVVGSPGRGAQLGGRRSWIRA